MNKEQSVSTKKSCFVSKHELATKVDERGHEDRNEYKEDDEEKAIKEHSLIVNSLGLTLIKKILVCILKLVKYTITLINHLKIH